MSTGRLWTIVGVEGDVTLWVNGGVVMLYTGDALVTDFDEDHLLDRSLIGAPAEMTHAQVRELAQLMLDVTTLEPGL